MGPLSIVVVCAARLSTLHQWRHRPTPLFLYELDLFLVDRDTVRFSGKSMITRVCVGVKPVIDCLSGSVDAEPLQAIANLR